MSIGKQIHAFLKVSEIFLLQSGVTVMHDRWSAQEKVGAAHDDHTLRLGELIAYNAKVKPGNTGNGGNGNQGSGGMRKYRQDSV